MSGGVAYVLDLDGKFADRCNREMVDLEPLLEGDEAEAVRVAIMKHVTYTGSRYAERLLADWTNVRRRMVTVMPRDYKRALAEQAKRRALEQDREVAVLAAQGAVAKAAAEAAAAAR